VGTCVNAKQFYYLYIRNLFLGSLRLPISYISKSTQKAIFKIADVTRLNYYASSNKFQYNNVEI
jgi:hypothetical protein